jgi:GT2 family glycosyltransferase
VSVIVAVLNAEGTIGEQLDALAAQTSSLSWELIVVDNGSTDATREIAGAARHRFAMLEIVDANERVGLAHARNAGIRSARGALLLFCDGDDRVAEGWVEAMARAAGSCEVLGGSLDRTLLNDDEWLTPDRRRSDGLQLWPGFLSFPSGANCGFRSSVFEAIGGFDETYVGGAEDVEFAWRAQLAGHRACFVPDAVVHYRERASAREIARQFFRYGIQDPHLYRDYARRGMPSSRLRAGLGAWLHLIAFAPRSLRTRAGRRQWLRSAAHRAGRIVGSTRAGTLYL